MSTEGQTRQWYFCLRHHQVEPREGCKAIDRLGPYSSPEEAQRALETVAERNADWENDPLWNDDVDEDQ